MAALDEPALVAALRDPHDGSALSARDGEAFVFAGGRRYPSIDGRPVLLDETTSLFSLDDVAEMRATTQDRAYRDSGSLKNYVRKSLLPQLSWDPEQTARFERLAGPAAGRPVLILGAGDRIGEYRRVFAGSTVVASDVHLQFGADCVIDAHRIPFADGTFAVVLADQVLEHTCRPWEVSAEMQRVTAAGGRVHIEVPFNFPFHGVPFDFFRFTPTALRFLLSRSAIEALDVSEGRFSAAATALSYGVIDSFSGRRARQAALLGTRLGLWWMKYLDAAGTRDGRYNSPKGLYVTALVDHRARSDREMLADVKAHLDGRAP